MSGEHELFSCALGTQYYKTVLRAPKCFRHAVTRTKTQEGLEALPAARTSRARVRAQPPGRGGCDGAEAERAAHVHGLRAGEPVPPLGAALAGGGA